MTAPIGDTTDPDGPVSAVKATMAGTHNGPLALPTGEVSATGRRLRFPMAFFDRLDEEGLIVEERRHYDVAPQQEQLGLSLDAPMSGSVVGAS